MRRRPTQRAEPRDERALATEGGDERDYEKIGAAEKMMWDAVPHRTNNTDR